MTSVDRAPAALHDSTAPSRREQMVEASVEAIETVTSTALSRWPSVGPAVMLTVGRTVSMVQLRAVAAPAPTASAAVTENVVGPWARPAALATASVSPAAVHTGAPPLNDQQMVARSDETRVNEALVELRVEPLAGPAVMVTVGRTESMVQLRASTAPTPIASRP